MKKTLLISLLYLLSCDMIDNTEATVGDIKECIREAKVQEELREYEPDVEGCICDAINMYCGTSFDTNLNQWWYDMQDWAKSDTNNYNTLLALSTALIDEGKKMEDALSKELIMCGNEWINEDILKIRN